MDNRSMSTRQSHLEETVEETDMAVEATEVNR